MIGSPRVHYRQVDSTNERARALAAAGAPHGTLVSADEQTAGHGRHGRRWLAPPGRALLASFVVRGLTEAEALLPLCAGLAVCEAGETLAPVRCSLKWPNDVWIERRKAAGILVEGRPAQGWAVIGVGLNVSTTVDQLPQELREAATSLLIASGEHITVETAREALTRTLAARLADSPEQTLARWRARDALLGEHVRWEGRGGQGGAGLKGGEGRAAGISDTGSLLVETSAGCVALDAGEVRLGWER